MPYVILRPRGDYDTRQHVAAAAGCDLYLEQHFNSAVDPGVTYPAGLYLDGDEPSRALAREYAARVSEVCPVRGGEPRAIPLGPGDRGRVNLRYVASPRAILEPGFGSNPAFAAWAQSADGVEALAGALVHVVRGACPRGGVVALSVGHLGKAQAPDDRGAPLAGGGWEGDLALRVVDRAHEMLAERGAPGDSLGAVDAVGVS